LIPLVDGFKFAFAQRGFPGGLGGIDFGFGVFEVTLHFERPLQVEGVMHALSVAQEMGAALPVRALGEGVIGRPVVMDGIAGEGGQDAQLIHRGGAAFLMVEIDRQLLRRGDVEPVAPPLGAGAGFVEMGDFRRLDGAFDLFHDWLGVASRVGENVNHAAGR